MTLQTKEGPAVVNETINYLNRISAVPMLKWNEELSKAARDHVIDIGAKGLCTHESSDGTPFAKRLDKYGKTVICSGENMSFSCETALEVILQLVIDDGVPNRGHRLSIFKPDFRCCGIFSGAHKVNKTMTTIDYAGGFIKIGEEDPFERQMNEFLKEEVQFDNMPPNIKTI